MLSSSLFPPGLSPYDQCWQQCCGTKVPTSKRTKSFAAILREKTRHSVHTNHFWFSLKMSKLSARRLFLYLLCMSFSDLFSSALLRERTCTVYIQPIYFPLSSTLDYRGSRSGIKEHLKVTCRVGLTLREHREQVTLDTLERVSNSYSYFQLYLALFYNQNPLLNTHSFTTKTHKLDILFLLHNSLIITVIYGNIFPWSSAIILDRET